MIPTLRGRSALARLARALPAVVLVALAACGGDDGGNGPDPSGSVTYTGPFGSSVSSGVITFGSASAALRGDRAALTAAIQLTGTLAFAGGGSVTLSGTLDGTVLALTGSGYAFSGATVNGSTISGSFTGPGGESGTFTATLTSDGNAVKVLCGTYDGDDSGVFSLALLPDRTGGVIVGSQTGTARAGAGANQVEIIADALPGVVIATGTLSADGTAIAGNWEDPGGNSGGFEGSVGACTASSATTFTGFILGDSRLNGGLVLEFAVAPTGNTAAALVTGSVITPTSGAPLTLTGSVLANGGFTATDQGNSYRLEGVLEDGVVYGNWRLASGGFSIGYFIATPGGVPYCGTYTSSTSAAGNFDVLVKGASVTGAFRGSPADSPIYGTFTTLASGSAYAYAASGSGFSHSITNGAYTGPSATGNITWTDSGIFNAGVFTVTGAYSATRCPGT